MASSDWKKVVSQLAYKQKNSDIAVQIFQDDRGRSKRRSERERSRIEVNQQPGRWRSARMT